MATATTSGDQQTVSSMSSTTGPDGADSGAPKLEEDFLSSGRTGRRNAIPDIFCPGARVSTAELPGDFARLSCEGNDTPSQASLRISAFLSHQIRGRGHPQRAPTQAKAHDRSPQMLYPKRRIILMVIPVLY